MEALKKSVEREKRESRLEGKKEGKEEGKIEGRKERNREIAREMILDGEEIQKIVKYTGLTPQWIGRLKNEISNEKEKN
ncbi:MAG: hypothetical protein AAF443_08895 [Chlamydiota bacterium]